MAFKSRRKTGGTVRRRSGSYGRKSPVRRSGTKSRRSGSAQTLRIVVEQRGVSNPIEQLLAPMLTPVTSRKAKF